MCVCMCMRVCVSRGVRSQCALAGEGAQGWLCGAGCLAADASRAGGPWTRLGGRRGAVRPWHEGAPTWPHGLGWAHADRCRRMRSSLHSPLRGCAMATPPCKHTYTHALPRTCCRSVVHTHLGGMPYMWFSSAMLNLGSASLSCRSGCVGGGRSCGERSGGVGGHLHEKGREGGEGNESSGRRVASRPHGGRAATACTRCSYPSMRRAPLPH